MCSLYGLYEGVVGLRSSYHLNPFCAFHIFILVQTLQPASYLVLTASGEFLPSAYNNGPPRVSGEFSEELIRTPRLTG